MLTPYVTIDSIPDFSKCKSGFGYMVYDIARSVAKLKQVDLLASNSRGDAFTLDDVYFLRRSFLLFFRYSYLAVSVVDMFRLWDSYKVSGRSLMKLLYYWFISGYYRHVIEAGNYDVVHIHGCGLYTELWMQLCKKSKHKYIVTLHGLNSFSDTVQLEPVGKRYERDFLKRVTEGEIPITVISTGMKRLIETTYDADDCPQITVVCNSFSFDSQEGGEFIDIRKKYGIPQKARVILYVGNIGMRKNQGQMIKAFNLLPENIANNTYVLFLGLNQDINYNIVEMADSTEYREHFVVCGAVERKDILHYYQQGDAVALMSISEGFGLSLIEGMHFGLPCMAFSDIDAFEDIYDKSAMIGVYKHDDESVKNGLVLLLSRHWDKIEIIEYSKKFEPQIMANNYVQVYKREIQHSS